MNITWFTAGDITMASSRLRAFLPGEALARRGHSVTFNPNLSNAADVIVVQKRADLTAYYSLWHHHTGAAVIFDCDDWYPWAVAVSQGVDLVTVDTSYKRRLLPNAEVVADVLDLPVNAPRKRHHRERLQEVAWFGHPDNLIHVWDVVEACKRLGINFTAITDVHHPAFRATDGLIGGYMWAGEDVDQALIEYDLVVCPWRFDTKFGADWVLSKSANRPLKAWGLGLPVAGTPIPSYTAAGMEFTAGTVEEWVSVLRRLQSAEVRERDAIRGYTHTANYQADVVAIRWEHMMYAAQRVRV